MSWTRQPGFLNGTPDDFKRFVQANALDFDDLLIESVRLLRHDDALRQLYNQRYEFVMISVTILVSIKEAI